MRSSKSKIVVGVVAFFLVLSVGYALFSRSINLNGTARAEGNFDIIFDRVEKITEEGSKGATATIEETKKHNLEVVVPELQYPGAYASVDTVIKNVGSVDAVLKGIIVKDVNGNEINVDELSSDDIEVTFSGVAKNEVMKPNDEKKITLMFKWKRESVNPSSSVTFEISMQYEQAIGGEDTTNPSSSDTFSFPSVTGILGDNVKYVYNDGSINITGTGNMSGEENSISQEIGMNLSKTLSNGNEKIENILSMTLPEEINGTASPSDFGTKEELYSILTLPESDDGMGLSEDDANYVIKIIYANPKITSVDIQSGITSIRGRLFESLTANIDVTIPNSVTSIGNKVFRSSNLKSVNIGSGVSIISDQSFEGSEIPSININSTIKEVGNEAFSSTKTKSIILKDGIQKIGSKSFNNSDINKVTIGNGLTVVSDDAFNSANIQSLNLPNSITTLGNYAFAGFKVNTLTIPNSVTSIGEYALSNIKVNTMTFDNITSIGKYAFYNSTIGTLKIVSGPSTITSFSFINAKIDNLTLANDTKVIDSHAFADFSTDTLILPDSVTQLNDYAFGASTINSLKLGSGMNILTSPFTNANINNLDLGSGVTTLNNGSMSYINNLKKITIPKNITTIDEYAFNGCPNLTSVVNKTGKSFNWERIFGKDTSNIFETGTIEVDGRTITITK